MTREEAIKAIKANYPCGGYHKLCEALDIAIKTLEDFEALNAINLDLASENEDLVERIGKLVGFIDYLRNTAQGKKKSLNLLEKVVKGQLKEMRAEGENFVKPRTGEWIPVSERLPDKEGTYLLWGRFADDEEYQCFIGDYDEGCERFGYWQERFDPHTLGCLGSEFFEYECAIAWMPLPQPYKAESEGKE